MKPILLQFAPAPEDCEGQLKVLRTIDREGYAFQDFPQLGSAVELLSGDATQFVAKIKDRTYSVQIHFDDWDAPYYSDGSITFTETCEDLSPTALLKMEPLSPEGEWEDGVAYMRPVRAPDVQLYGQPSFIQNPEFPSRNGKPYFPFAVIENGWGDAGNINIFVALDSDDRPIAAHSEASCC